MREASITRSLHAYIPKKERTQEELDEIYRKRIDKVMKPYTVIDVLTKVYHRNFAEDLQQYIGENPEEFSTTSSEWGVARVWVNKLKIIRPESVFFQIPIDFQVDILVETTIKLEETRCGNAFIRNRYNIDKELRLRYSFDFRPCHLDCHFKGVILDEDDSLVANDKMHLSVDKYLLPVFLKGDYERIAQYIIETNQMDNYTEDVSFDPFAWLKAMDVKLYAGIFEEKNTLGEYFFYFGTANILNNKTGKVQYDAEINPGSIVIDVDTMRGNGETSTTTIGARNVTVTHEGVHHYFGRYYYYLQQTHGHQYCSYMCKRFDDRAEPHGNWTPVEIMEMQANKMPGYLMIPEYMGKKHAKKLLESYGGERSVRNMCRLITDMAEYYYTTKTMARTRLLDFGYKEVQGIHQRANGELVPAYLSTLEKGETYTIDEADGVREYIRNPEFRRTLDHGNYVYVNGSYCKNERKYVESNQFGELKLTPYALAHMEECCLVFKIRYDGITGIFANGVLHKGNGRGRKTIQYVKRDGTSAYTDEGLARRRSILKERSVQYIVEKHFNEMLVDLMDNRNMKKGDLAEATGLSPDTIQNMRNRTDRMFPVQEIAAVAIALHLDPKASEEFLRCAPTAFLDTEEMFLYQYAMYHWYELSVSQVNRLLVEMDAQPLTNLVDGYDESGMEIEEAV